MLVQVELAHRMAPLEAKTQFERQVQATTGGINRTLWDSSVSGLRGRLPVVPDDVTARGGYEPDGGHSEGGGEVRRNEQVVQRSASVDRASERRERLQGSFSRQGIEELTALRKKGASRREAASIVEEYERHRSHKGDTVPQGLSEFEPIMCYEDPNGKLIPLETDYGYKRKLAQELQSQAAARIEVLEKTAAQIVSLHENVEAEYGKFAGELRKRCTELHAAVEQRETELLAQLERRRAVKLASLERDSEECHHLQSTLMGLVETVETLCETESDHDAFAVKVAGPQAVLSNMLAREDRWVPDVATTFGYQVEAFLFFAS